MHSFHRHAVWFLCFCLSAAAQAAADDTGEALAAAQRATLFLSTQVASHGGYVWRYGSDLSLREGEGVVDDSTIWIQPPGTPAVGEAFVALYEATGGAVFLDAALAAAEALRQGQMRSGGWQASIEFSPERRKKWAYRVEPPAPKQKDQSSLDDDKTQSAIRFLVKLDRAVAFEHGAVHEMALYALDGLLTKGQFANGGFPQVWSSDRVDQTVPGQPAGLPSEWPREYPGHQEYWQRPTLNDNLIADVIETLLLAAEVYDEPRYRDAVVRAADFLLLAQLPEPQPAWAQQYDEAMHPIWARKFEPPAVTGGESQGVIAILMTVYRHTGDRRYLEPLPRALDYLEGSQLSDGSLARFYELGTNRPLYFTRDYKLTYDDGDLPTHYSFKVPSRLAALRKELGQLARLSEADRIASLRSPERKPPSAKTIRSVIDSMDPRGAWLSKDGLRYHQQPGEVINMKRAVANLTALAAFLKAESPPGR